MSEVKRMKYCVNGEWKDSKTEKWLPVTDSSTGEVIAEVPSCTQDEVLEAIDAADRAFKAWSQVSISKRTQMMFKWRNILVAHLEELTYLCAKELGKTLGEALLAPTKIYVKPVLKVLEEVDVKGISHITGGGFYENIPRSLKKGCCARIHKADVRTPALFHLMQKEGGISEHDMFNTFNMGVGMVLTVPAEQADKALEILHANGEPEAYRLGVIAEGEGVELC